MQLINVSYAIEEDLRSHRHTIQLQEIVNRETIISIKVLQYSTLENYKSDDIEPSIVHVMTYDPQLHEVKDISQWNFYKKMMYYCFLNDLLTNRKKKQNQNIIHKELSNLEQKYSNQLISMLTCDGNRAYTVAKSTWKRIPFSFTVVTSEWFPAKTSSCMVLYSLWIESILFTTVCIFGLCLSSTTWI